jgi:RNA polymerase sigma-70 factor (ECF subfamily)
VSAERLRAVNVAMQALPTDLRQAMSLFVDQEMSYAEIAAIEGCTAKAAETRIYRARQLLKESLKDVRS